MGKKLRHVDVILFGCLYISLILSISIYAPFVSRLIKIKFRTWFLIWMHQKGRRDNNVPVKDEAIKLEAYQKTNSYLFVLIDYFF